MNARPNLLRARGGHEHAAVTPMELFFDLVFVFAVTQVSHSLLEHLSWAGALQALMLFLAVWWLWSFTAWATNWLDPGSIAVRLLLFALMLGSLLLSASIPEAFGEKGWMFGCAFAAMQIGRSLFVTAALRGHRPANYRSFVRLTIWFVLSGALWVFGAFATGGERVASWAIALALEYAAPWLYFWVPGLGRSSTTDWDIEGTHLAERCGLFVIIALGESILVTGAGFAELEWSTATIAGFVVAFVSSVAMWWVYFDTGATRARHRIAGSDDPGRQGRLAYTYIHFLIVAGIIVSAVADNIVLERPGQADAVDKTVILCGTAIYLLGNASFKWVTNDRRAPPLSHLAGLALLLALVPFAVAGSASALSLGAATTGVLVIVATWESMALRRAPAPRRADAT
jgi:low temperature requirement protein LtrA